MAASQLIQPGFTGTSPIRYLVTRGILGEPVTSIIGISNSENGYDIDVVYQLDNGSIVLGSGFSLISPTEPASNLVTGVLSLPSSVNNSVVYQKGDGSLKLANL